MIEILIVIGGFIYGSAGGRIPCQDDIYGIIRIWKESKPKKDTIVTKKHIDYLQ